MEKIKLDRIINLIFTLYILSLYLFTYKEGLYVISNGLALSFVFLVLIKIFISKAKFKINRFLIYHIIFLVIGILSYFYAPNKGLVIGQARTLILIYIVMFAIVNYFDTPNKVELSIKSFILAGFISSLYIVSVSDFSNLTRFGRELGNVNAVGMMIGISAIFSLNEYIRFKKLRNLIYLIPMISVILLTGSRKSILFIVLTILYVVYFDNRSNIQGKIKFLMVSSLIVILAFYLIFEVPIFYKILGVRLEQSFAMFTGVGKVDSSTMTRMSMIKFGGNLFKEKPFLGYGLNNYRVMYGSYYDYQMYSHNNFIELLVNLGIIGTFLYYLTNFKVFRDLKDFIKKHKDTGLVGVFIGIILMYFLLGPSLVYYYSKHFSYLLALASVIPRVYYMKEIK